MLPQVLLPTLPLITLLPKHVVPAPVTPLVKFAWIMQRAIRMVPTTAFTPLPLKEILLDSSAAPDEPFPSLNPSLLFFERTEFETCAELLGASTSMPFELPLM